ncbi:chondroadherin-like [Spea bombifrons]|uniref:chondroadherin-like n=1 Tax=Spea bombifrons TaxID=233779 RepID=UPI002349E926|nr:chondroadherin-like [Spea bombifrons]
MVILKWHFNMGCLMLVLLMMIARKVNTMAQCPDSCTCLLPQQHIFCSNASLTSPPSQLNNNTVELHLQHNHFVVLHPRFIQDLPQLRSLHLSNCNISTIQSDAFVEVTSIHYLYLDSNQLSSFEDGAFNNLTSLIYLQLSKNKITYIQPGLFADLTELSNLHLSHNMLYELADQTLAGVTGLHWLDLGYNFISNISSNSFKDMVYLRRLNLEMNNLSSIPLSLSSIRGLQMLRLSGNNIKRVSAGSTGRRLRFLTELYLDGVGLETVSPLSFSKLRRLEVLDLRNNSLQNLPISRLKAFTKMYLTGNPWRCDCSIIKLHTRLAGRKEKDPEQQVLCQSPKALEGKNLISVHLDLLTCPGFGEASVNTATPVFPDGSRITQPPIITMAATSKTTMAFKTSTTKQLFQSTTLANEVDVDLRDPCLSDHISDVSVAALGQESLIVSWSVSGYYNQFQVRYSAGDEESTLDVIGELRQVQLYHLHADTNYIVCIIPQSIDIFKCHDPKPMQCEYGKTNSALEQPQQVYSPSKTTPSPFVTTGVSVAVVVLVAAVVFIAYTLRSHKINFQRYYNEEEADRVGKQTSDPYKLYCTDDNTEDDRQMYVTAASLWGMDNDKYDCNLAEPVSLSSVANYASL